MVRTARTSDATPIIEVNDFRAAYKNKTVLENVTFDVFPERSSCSPADRDAENRRRSNT